MIGTVITKLESALKEGDELLAEIEINSCDDDLPPNIDGIRFNLEDWTRVEGSRGLGFR